MEKSACIFPGIGYHSDKPLLYFAKKLAKAFGYRIVEVSYSGFPLDILGDTEKMKAAFVSALKQTETVLEKENFEAAGECLFISKSIGTAVAAAFQKAHGITAKNIYFTPVAESFDFMAPKSGIVFHGTLDPWADTDTIRTVCRELDLPAYITEGANHSMETGDVGRDIEELGKIMSVCKSYISDGENAFMT